ncbi:hypothetical protein E4U61_006063 [Claviceps capensis]|nr:hypothetical protein E4U61_006063 [Claviceps capensis]
MSRAARHERCDVTWNKKRASNYNTGIDAHRSGFMTANFVSATAKEKEKKSNTCDEVASPSS